jgi:putative membrane protein
MAGWGYLVMILGVALPLALLVGGAVWLGGLAVRGRFSVPRPAERILAARYARGELDEDEYRHQLAVLRASAGNRPEDRGSS